jgi:hypothetical protein
MEMGILSKYILDKIMKMKEKAHKINYERVIRWY